MGQYEEYLKNSYTLGHTLLVAAAASFGIILSCVVLQAQVGDYGLLPQNAINEMTGYFVFFACVWISYFGAAVLVWKTKNLFLSHIDSWMPIALAGSIFLIVAGIAFFWITSLTSNSASSGELPIRTQTQPFSFFSVLLGMVVYIFVLTVISSIFGGVASLYFNRENRRDSVVPDR